MLDLPTLIIIIECSTHQARIVKLLAP